MDNNSRVNFEPLHQTSAFNKSTPTTKIKKRITPTLLVAKENVSLEDLMTRRMGNHAVEGF